MPVNNSNSVEKRKTLIKVSAIVASTPIITSGNWTKPIIKSVFVPAHAATSEIRPEIPPVLVQQCSFTADAMQVSLIGNQSQSLDPSVSLTITNTGQTPLDHPSSSSSAGLSLNPTFGPVQYGMALNGGIPNPLLPGQSHTFTLFSLGAANCPTSGDLVFTFARNAASCNLTLAIVCVDLPN